MSFTNNINYSLNITGGNLTVSGSSTVGNLRAGDVTVGNINFTGSLYQNGEPYVSSQWTTTSGNLSYTSGSVLTTNLEATNVSAGAFVGSSASLSGNLTVGGDLTVSGTTTTVNTETTILEDNLLVLNSGPAGAADAGLLMKRFVTGTSGSSNYAGMFYKETTDEMTFALTNSDPGASPVTVDSYLPIRAQSLTLESSGSLNARGDSNTIGSLFTTGGNVGIGRTNPLEKLHVDGNIISYGITTGSLHMIGFDATAGNIGTFLVRTNLLATGNSNTIGSLFTTGGNVGIGTSSPTANLEISSAGTAILKISGDNTNTLPDNGSVQCAIQMTTDNGGSGININYGNGTGTNTLNIESATTSATTSSLFINGSNNVGIRTTAPSFTLDVNGTFEASNSNGAMLFASSGNLGVGTTTPGYKLTVSGDIYATGDIVAFSDQRLKTDVVTVTDALEKVNAMRGVYYTMTKTGQRGLGVIAQEVQQILPEIVAEKEEYLGVAYGNIVGVLIEAIKELNEKVRYLEDKLDQ